MVIHLKNNILNNSKTLSQAILSTPIKSIVTNVLFVFIGFITSRCTIWKSYAPFGISLLSAVEYNQTLASFIGSFIGYLIPSESHISIKYISCIVAILAVRWALSELKGIIKHPLFAPSLTFITILITELAVTVSGELYLDKILICISEALIGATISYFFCGTFNFIHNDNKRIPNYQELACICMTVCIIMLSLDNIKLGYVSVGKVLSSIMIMLCAKYSGISAGSIAGIICGLIFSLSNFELSYIFGAFAFAGLMCGLFSFFGKIGIALTFSICNILFSLQTGDISKIISCIYESIFSGIIFIIMPEYISNKFSNLIGKSQGYTTTEGLRSLFTTRLNFTSNAFFSVSDSVETIFDKLSKIGTSKIGNIYNKTTTDICSNCGIRTLCWGENKEKTQSTFESLLEILLKNGNLDIDSIPENFIKKCPKHHEITRAINKYYNEYNSHLAAEKRIVEFRKVLSEQFSGMGEILKDISNDFENYEMFDKEKSEIIGETIKLLGLTPIDVSYRTNKLGAITIEMDIAGTNKEKIEKINISKELSKLCGQLMDSPIVSEYSTGVKLQICQRPIYNTSVGFSQHICNNGKFCGDNFKQFKDGLGRSISIISDGMGTGGRAAVDGAMSTEIMSTLLKSGISFNSAFKTLNSALLVKSEDESLSALDVFSLDLFSGQATFLKAGAPITFVQHNNEIICINNPSLPVGILTNVNFSKQELKLDDGDKILMMSDGMIFDSDEWILDEFKKWSDMPSSEFSEYLLQKAISLNSNGHDDDITVVAIKISKNPINNILD